VVLAAHGSRPLLTAGGMSLVERAVRMCFAQGIERVVVVVGEEAESVARAARRALPPTTPERIEIVRARDGVTEHGPALAAASLAVAHERVFAVVTADIVFTGGALTELLRSAEPAYLAAGVQDRAADGGAFVFGPEIFPVQRSVEAEGDPTLTGAFLRLAETEALRPVRETAPSGWKVVRTGEDLHAARRMLRRSLGKPSDGPVSHYVNRPVSTRVTMVLAPLRIPPGAITLVAGLMGLAGAWGLAWGQGLMSGLLIQATNILDGADGETSRLHFRTSQRGAAIDAAIDRIVDGSLVAGVALWLWPFHPSFEFKVAILTSAAYGWGFIAYLFQSKLTGFEVSGADRPLVMLLGGRDSRLLILAAGTTVYEPGAAVAAGWVIYLSSVLRRVFLMRRRPRTTPAVAPSPDEVGDPAQGNLQEER
jgi:hypothetical protein